MDQRHPLSKYRAILVALVLAGVLAAPAAAQISFELDYPPPEPGTYRLPPIKPAADGRVLDADGKKHKLRDLTRGRISILSFIYTRCADPRACPFASGVLYRIHEASKADPVLAKNLQLLTFSFD